MKTTVLILFLSLAFTTPPALAIKIADTDIPDTLTLDQDESPLVLNGAGIRKKYFMKIYIGALYLPTKQTSVATITTGDDARSIHMHILHSSISKKKITGAWKDGLAANLPEGEMTALTIKLQQFNNLFSDVHEGDVIRIDYLPGTGTQVTINSEVRGSVKGTDFFNALLLVWLGDDPISSDLKKAMLGGG